MIVKPTHRDIGGVQRHVAGWRGPAMKGTPRRMLSGHFALPEETEASLADKILYWLDQGQRGSCAGCMADNCHMLSLSALGITPQLGSISFAYAMGRKLEGMPLSVDSGLYIPDAFRALTEFGICREELMPYSLPIDAEPSAEAIEDAAQQKSLLSLEIDCGTRSDKHALIQRSLLDGFAVGFGMNLPEGFESDSCLSTGYIPLPTPETVYIGGHAMTIIGFMRTAAGKVIYILLNSWGRGVGDKGLFYLPGEYIDLGIATDFETIRQVRHS